MARVRLDLQMITANGLEPVMTALAADGHKFTNDGQFTRLLIVNGATPFTLTVQTPGEEDGLAVAEREFAIGADKTCVIGPWPREYYNQGDGMVYVDYSDVADGAVNGAQLWAGGIGDSLDLLTESGEIVLTETGRSMHR